MKDPITLLLHPLTAIAKLLGPGGANRTVADRLLMKQQLLAINHSRTRPPNLSVVDRFFLGFWSFFLSPCRILLSAIIITSSTPLRFPKALKKCKYQWLYSPRKKGKPRPNGPSADGCSRTSYARLLDGSAVDLQEVLGLSVLRRDVRGAMCWRRPDAQRHLSAICQR